MISGKAREDALEDIEISTFADACSASAPDPSGWVSKWFAEREVFCTRRPAHTDGIHVAKYHGKLLRIWEEGDVFW